MAAKNKLAVQISDTEARIRGLVKLLMNSDNPRLRPHRMRELENLKEQLKEYREREKEQGYG